MCLDEATKGSLKIVLAQVWLLLAPKLLEPFIFVGREETEGEKSTEAELLKG